MHPVTYLKISMIFLEASLTQLSSWIKSTFINRDIKSVHDAGKMLKNKLVEDKKNQFIIIRFIKLVLRIFTWIGKGIYFIYSYNKSSIEKCWYIFHNRLIPDRIKEIALLGISDTAKITLIIAKETGIRIVGIYDNVEGLRFYGHRVSHYTHLRGYEGKILISSAINIEEKVEKLKKLGIKEKNILWQKSL